MKRWLVAIYILSLNVEVYSQTIDTTNVTSADISLTKDEKNFQTQIITSKTLQSSVRSGFISYNNFVKLNATNNGTAAEANITYLLNGFNLNMHASTPVSSKSQRVKPLSLAGLSNNSSITFGLQKIVWGRKFEWTDSESYEKARKAIGKHEQDDFSTNDLTEEEKAKFYSVAGAGINWGTSFYYGAKVGVEQQEFNYVVNESTLEDKETSKTAVNFSANFGMLNDIGIWAISFTYQDGYQADDPIKYYVPINNLGVLIEKNLSPSAPEHRSSEKIRIEYLSLGKPKYDAEKGYRRSPFRINPNINIEFSQEVFSFELPVYFLTSDDAGTNFNGGIYTGYLSDRNFEFNTDRNNIGFGVFIGANFTNLFQ